MLISGKLMDRLNTSTLMGMRTEASMLSLLRLSRRDSGIRLLSRILGTNVFDVMTLHGLHLLLLQKCYVVSVRRLLPDQFQLSTILHRFKNLDCIHQVAISIYRIKISKTELNNGS